MFHWEHLLCPSVQLFRNYSLHGSTVQKHISILFSRKSIPKDLLFHPRCQLLWTKRIRHSLLQWLVSTKDVSSKVLVLSSLFVTITWFGTVLTFRKVIAFSFKTFEFLFSTILTNSTEFSKIKFFLGSSKFCTKAEQSTSSSTEI